MHMVSRKGLNKAKLETVRILKNPTTVVTASVEVLTKEEATVYVKELDLFVRVMLLEGQPVVLSLGKLCEELGFWYHWTSGQKPNLIKNGRKINCNAANYAPFVVPGLSTSSFASSTPTSPTSSSQDTVITTDYPATERFQSVSEEVRGHPSHEPAEIENEDNETVRRNPLRDLPEWLEEMSENLVDESVPAHSDAFASSSRKSAAEPRGKVVSGKHSIFTHFPKDRTSCRRRVGTVVPKAEEHSGDLITADHNILSEGCESRNNHRYVVVVEDLATHWIQSFPCKTQTYQETQKSFQKCLESTKKPKVLYTDNFLEFGKSCEELSWNPCTSTPHRLEINEIVENSAQN